MARRLLVTNVIAYCLMVLVVLLTTYGKAKPSGLYNFMKLSIRWPMSYCTSPLASKWGGSCEKPIRAHFIVHGFWPMYWDDKDDATIFRDNDESFVQPFNASGCSETKPASEYLINESLFNSQLRSNDMIKYWPNIFNYSYLDSNLRIWRGQWIRYGKCSKYRQNPFSYFKTPIDYIKKHDFLGILAIGKIYPNDGEYDPFRILKCIQGSLNVKPQIRCTTDTNGTVLFSEILLCFYRDGSAMPCRYDFYDCPKFKPRDGQKFKFPAALKY